MPVNCEFKPLPANHGNQIVEMWVVCRNINEERVEIAEHPDGAMKAYASKEQAERARLELAMSDSSDGDRLWTVETIWLLHKGWSDLPAEVLKRAAIRRELRKSGQLD